MSRSIYEHTQLPEICTPSLDDLDILANISSRSCQKARLINITEQLPAGPECNKEPLKLRIMHSLSESKRNYLAEKAISCLIYRDI